MASMGPRRYRRGNSWVSVFQATVASASMGPRRYRRGNPHRRAERCLPTRCFNGAATLSSRKSDSTVIEWDASAKLQWGRDVIVAEISWGRRWRSQFGMLQWGRDVIVAEIADGSSECWWSTSLQWGRDVIVAEIRDGCRGVGDDRCFNGAATLSSRKWQTSRGLYSQGFCYALSSGSDSQSSLGVRSGLETVNFPAK